MPSILIPIPPGIAPSGLTTLIVDIYAAGALIASPACTESPASSGAYSASFTSPATAAAYYGAIIDTVTANPVTGAGIYGNVGFQTDAAGNEITGGGGNGLVGPSSVTLTFHDGNGAPVPSAQFSIHGVGAGQANGNGVAAFGLSNGTYTVSTNPVGLTLFADVTFTVSGTTTHTITGTTVVVPSPPTFEQTTAYYYTDGPNVVIEYTMIAVPSGSGFEFDGRLMAATSDASNLWTAPLYKGATYKVQCGDGEPVDIVVPESAGSSTPLMNLLRG